MKNIIIFGTGEFGKDAYDYYKVQNNISIIAFCDNDEKKQNTTIFDIKIIHPNSILTLEYDEIVIASSFDDEIYKQLVGMKISDNNINTLNLNQIKLQLSQGDKLLLAERLMLDLADLFNKKNITYHIDHGTLLGIIRDESLMPWDIDVDFAIQSNDKDMVLKVLEKFLVTYQSKYCKYNDWKCSIHNCAMTLNNKNELLPMVIKVFNDTDDETSNSFFVDIELKYIFNSNLYWMVGSRKLSAPIAFCFPPDEVRFKNQKVKVPNNTFDYLKLLYGDWKKIVKEWSYNQYTNINN